MRFSGPPKIEQKYRFFASKSAKKCAFLSFSQKMMHTPNGVCTKIEKNGCDYTRQSSPENVFTRAAVTQKNPPIYTVLNAAFFASPPWVTVHRVHSQRQAAAPVGPHRGRLSCLPWKNFLKFFFSKYFYNLKIFFE